MTAACEFGNYPNLIGIAIDHGYLDDVDQTIDSYKIYTRSNFNPYDYGYMWWKRETGDYDVNYAWGHGGQYIMMIPELDTVIAISSNLANNDGSRRYQRQVFQWMEEDVIPFLENNEAVNP